MQLFGGGDEFLQRSDVPQWNLIPGTYTLSGFSMTPNGGSIDDTKTELKQESEMIISSKVAHLWGNNAIGSGVKLPQSLYLTEGIYTLSFLCRHNDPNNNYAYPIGLYDDSAAENKLLGQFGARKTFEKTSITFAVNESKNYGSLRIGTTSGAPYPAGSIYFADFKLEHGSLATSWAPALQDFVMKSDQVLTTKNLIQALFSDELVNVVDNSFDMNNASPGIYRSWGKKPINTPNYCQPWAKYFAIPFVEGDSDDMIQIAIDSNGNIFIRTKGGQPAAWNLWHSVNLGQ